MITLLNIEKLRAARGFELQAALVLGGEDLLDGLGGLFTWDPESELDDDGFYVVKYAREDVGRWIRVQTIGLILQSPSGHFWRVSVDDVGALSTTDLGDELPRGDA